MKRIDSNVSRTTGRPGRPAALFAILLMLSVASPAQAYLDPGTGSLIIQIILGGIAGIMVAGKLYWTRLKAFFGFSTGDVATEKDAADTDAD